MRWRRGRMPDEVLGRVGNFAVVGLSEELEREDEDLLHLGKLPDGKAVGSGAAHAVDGGHVAVVELGGVAAGEEADDLVVVHADVVHAARGSHDGAAWPRLGGRGWPRHDHCGCHCCLGREGGLDGPCASVPLLQCVLESLPSHPQRRQQLRPCASSRLRPSAGIDPCAKKPASVCSRVCKHSRRSLSKPPGVTVVEA